MTRRTTRIVRRLLVATLALLAVLAVWLTIDVPLDAETRRWLEAPAPPSSAAVDAATHIRVLGAAAEREGVARDRVDPQGRCAALDLGCAAYVAEHRELVLAALPRSDDYWAAYGAVLRAEGISSDVGRVLELPWSAYLEAVRFSVMRELATAGLLRPGFVVEAVEAQRRLLAESPFLIDKMVFTATTGMAFGAANVALQSTPADDPGFHQLVRALRPLSPTEASLRRAMSGELRFMTSQPQEGFWSELVLKRRHLANLSRRILAVSVEESELAAREFWTSVPREPAELSWWDRLFDPVGSVLASVAMPAYSQYAENVRMLDVSSTLARTGAAIRTGEPYPNTASSPEHLPGWVWVYDQGALCLAPGEDALRAMQRDTVCQRAAIDPR